MQSEAKRNKMFSEKDWIIFFFNPINLLMHLSAEESFSGNGQSSVITVLLNSFFFFSWMITTKATMITITKHETHS